MLLLLLPLFCYATAAAKVKGETCNGLCVLIVGPLQIEYGFSGTMQLEYVLSLVSDVNLPTPSSCS